MKGGYKIIDFKNVSLSGTPVTMTDVLVDLLNNYEKVVLLSHVVLSGSAKDDCFSTVLSDGAGGVKLNCYDGYISINSSGAVTYTVASASGMAGDIADLQGDLADTNSMIAPAWSATATYTKNTIVRDGGQLYKAKQNVPTGTATSNTVYWEITNEADLIKSLKEGDFDTSILADMFCLRKVYNTSDFDIDKINKPNGYIFRCNDEVSGTLPTSVIGGNAFLIAGFSAISQTSGDPIYGVQIAIGFGSARIAIRSRGYAAQSAPWSQWLLINSTTP